ncbi:hypothetical protein Hanom_Chr09g00822141 [Helianthus anomalus]
MPLDARVQVCVLSITRVCSFEHFKCKNTGNSKKIRIYFQTVPVKVTTGLILACLASVLMHSSRPMRKTMHLSIR